MMIEQFPNLKLKRKFLAVLVAACYGAAAQANPLAPQVVAGQATFNQQGHVFSVTNTPNTIINWQNFSISPNEITRFIQQSGDSKVLNRIVGQDPSKILGSLQSNGKVYLINPNGVLFGKDARVDVNGLVASSLAISNSDFLAGKNNFAGDGAGKVVNQGSITTPGGGQVYLIASSVENSGVITSPQGEVVLAAGKSVQLVDSANPDVHVVVSAPSDQALNLGQMLAAGGKVGIYGALVSQRGRVSADSAAVGANGKIVLKASGTTLLEAGSHTSANNSAGQGGEIQLLGERVGLTGDARVQADGAAGGGSVLVGGDYQGKNAAVPNARQSFVGPDASISADATAHGDGGKIIVWGDQAARMHGALSARGGAQGGNGGLVETSGHFIDVAGARVDTGAQAGQGATGLWLLDPDYIEVSSGGTATLPQVADFDAGSGTSMIAASTINSATSNVLLQANHDISFNEAVSIVAANVGLTAQARGNISVNAALGTNHGDITLQANLGATDAATAAGSGAVTLGAAVSTGGGKLALSGAAVTLNAAANVGLGDAELRVNKAGGGVTIGSAGSLTGSSDSSASPLFSFIADEVTLSGAVNGGGKDQGTSVSFTPFTAGRGIAVAASKVGDKLTLSPSDLGRVSALNVNIGSSAGGGVAVDGALNLANVRNIFIESAGDIAINSTVQASSADGTVYAGTYGSGGIVFGTQGGLSARNVLLRSDNMDLGSRAGAISATGKASLSPYTPTAAIKLGKGASGDSGTLVLTADELRVVSAPTLNIGDGDGYTGTLSVAGALDLASGGTAGSSVLQLSGGSIAVGADASVAAAGTLRLNADAIVLGAEVSAGSVVLAPASAGLGITVGASACASESASCLLLNTLRYVNAPSLTIGSSNSTSGAGLITVAGIASAGDYVQRHANTTSISLLSNAGIAQTGAIDVASLAIVANGGIALGQYANHVERLSAQVGSASGGLAFKNDRSLAVAGIAAPGTVALNVAGAITQGSGLIQADRLELIATENIGTSAAALSAMVSQLSAESTASSGSSLINISNANYTANPVAGHGAKLAVDLLKVRTGNAGAVTLNNTGALVVDGEVGSHSGKITLVAHSPLTINGSVRTQSGDIELTAGSSGSSSDQLTFASNAQVSSVSGNITLAAGAAIVGATESTVQAAPGKLVTLASQNTPVPPVVTPPVEPPVVTPPVEPPVVVPPVVTPPVEPPVVVPPVVTPPVVPPVVVPPVVTPPVEPPVVVPPVVTPPVEPPVVIPPVVTPPVVTPPVEPPVVTPPVVPPLPSSDICTIAPNSALCQVISPPTVSEPVKPVQIAVNEVIATITASKRAVQSEPATASGTASSSSSGGPAATSSTPDDKASAKDDTKTTASSDKSGMKNEPVKKLYCN